MVTRRNPFDPPRRSFLSRLALGAGAALLTPFVKTLEAQAQGTTRKRFLLVLQGNGFGWKQFTPLELREPASVGDHIQIASQGYVDSTRFAALPAALAPLEARYRNKILIVDGLTNRQNGPTANHGNGCSAVTCTPNSSGGEGGKSGGISFDQHLATSTAMGGGFFRSVDLGVFTDSSNGSHLSAGAGRGVPVVTKPSEAIMRYFAGVMPSSDGTAALLVAKKKHLFDLMSADIKRLSSSLPATERAKLDEYLESVGKLSKRILASPAGGLCKAGGPALPAGSAIEDNVDAMIDIAAEALACGLTQVASVSITTGGDHWGDWRKSVGEMWQGGIHGHAHGDPPHGSKALDRVWGWVATAIARAADRLSGVVEGGRTAFSQSTFLWQSTNGAAHHNPQWRWNGVVLGDAGGALRADGRYVKYPAPVKFTEWIQNVGPQYAPSGAPQARAWADLYCSLAHALGAPTDTFGSAGKEPVKGPLMEVMA